MTESLQNVLWNSPPNSSGHIAGKLSLCIGLPIMIRNNDATELCITKGQEAIVVCWDAATGPYGQLILENLFVKLIDPPKDVTIGDLPLNVIPMSRATSTIDCILPNDSVLRVTRQQALVLPNFSMTDFAAQGKTRKNNVVDLDKCQSHLSYYTCLSRSASAEVKIVSKNH